MNKFDCSTSTATLETAGIGETLAVLKVHAPVAAPEWARWLEEIGFIAGEQVSLMARAIPGGDPLVVRVGQSTFALRRAEAACVSVVPVEAFASSSSLERLALGGAQA
ncbi:FeoA family protein [Propionivibrio limicola]|uniref:FeoA family protein n=1 Tax=Propionivibrio limicola TaxID=167645 RepID=UPI001B86820D|nr:FeoA family protein [Propionivibrio limicola]